MVKYTDGSIISVVGKLHNNNKGEMYISLIH